MRVADLDMVVGRPGEFLIVDLREDRWAGVTPEERWFADGERLARDYQEVHEGVLMDREGNLRFIAEGGWS